MKKNIFIILFLPIYLLAQDNSINLNQKVSGLITTYEGSYLIVEEGFIQIQQSDPYTEYYRNIYNDFTIINPNTELKDDLNFTIIPFVSDKNIHNSYKFKEPLELGIFINLNEQSSMFLSEQGITLLDSITRKKLYYDK